MDYELIFLVNTFSTLFLTGLIWFVQIVQYPSFYLVDEDSFIHFHAHHTKRISFIVAPVMFLELISSAFLWHYSEWTSLPSIGFYIVLLIWMSTFFISVPKHNFLQQKKDPKVIHALVNTNWIRTCLWSIKAVLAFYLF
tara:strand:- start:2653 stop:3069 length:417 start_codon:yes stop_codon:yes gene_type:complete